MPPFLPFLPWQALLWFASPPGYYANHTRGEAREQLASLQGFAQLLASFPQGSWPSFPAGSRPGGGPGAAVEHPVWGVAAPAVIGYVRLLQLLCDEEIKRVRVWNDPLGDTTAGGALPNGVSAFKSGVGFVWFSVYSFF